MATAKVWLGYPVLHGVVWETEALHQQSTSVGSRHTMQSIKTHLELARRKERLDQIKVKDGSEIIHIILNRVDHVNLQVAERRCTDLRQVYVIALLQEVVVDLGRELVDLIRDSLWRRSAVLHIVLDTKVGVRTAGVVARCQQNTTGGLAQANHMRGSRRGENAILSDNQLRHTIASSQSNNLLHGGQRQVAAITPHHQRRTACAARYRRKNALHKVLRVVLLLKHGDTLTQT